MNERVKIAKNQMPETPHILVCPLDWGLGHATRCVPIIRRLISLKCRVLIAGSGRSLNFLRSEFAEATFIHLPSYRFFYSSKNRMAGSMLLSTPMILWGIFCEHRLLKKIIRKHQVHAVISDNRFGLWNKSIPCVYMTHQVRIKTGPGLRFLEPVLHKINRLFLKKFNWLWIPDNENTPNLSGELSHQALAGLNHRFIGPLSRFSGSEPIDDQPEEESCDILALISGPEPQRSIFESMIIEQASTVQKKIILLRGLPGGKTNLEINNNLSIYPHLESDRLKRLIVNAGIVVCRSGYSTIMDLAVLGKKAFFVPTPGQTEQEYLAKYLREQSICNFSPQNDFKIAEVTEQSDLFSGFRNFKCENELENALLDLLYLY
jgi:uncharacterized protein (TIGR00661 family)